MAHKILPSKKPPTRYLGEGVFLAGADGQRTGIEAEERLLPFLLCLGCRAVLCGAAAVDSWEKPSRVPVLGVGGQLSKRLSPFPRSERRGLGSQRNAKSAQLGCLLFSRRDCPARDIPSGTREMSLVLGSC